jgi:hypothetical protein
MGLADLDLAADLLIALGEIDLARACAAESSAPEEPWRPLEAC